MAHTETPWTTERSSAARNGLYIVATKPLFEGAKLAVRIAKLCKLKAFAGDADANAELIVTAVNAWHDVGRLNARVAELSRNAKSGAQQS